MSGVSHVATRISSSRDELPEGICIPTEDRGNEKSAHHTSRHHRDETDGRHATAHMASGW